MKLLFETSFINYPIIKHEWSRKDTPQIFVGFQFFVISCKKFNNYCILEVFSRILRYCINPARGDLIRLFSQSVFTLLMDEIISIENTTPLVSLAFLLFGYICNRLTFKPICLYYS